LWYKRAEQARRVAIFFSAATVAGAFGGIFAYGIEKLEGRARLPGWAWIVSIGVLANHDRTNDSFSSLLKVFSPLLWHLSDIGVCMMYVSWGPYILQGSS
jgi:hypothetical protein